MRGRRFLCVLAAVLAAVAGVFVLFEPDIRSHETVALVLFLLAIATAVLGLAPGGQDWSPLRRLSCVVLGVAWLVASLPVLVNLIAVSGCVCEPGAAQVSPLAPLGISARALGAFAAFATPVLLIAAALMPRRGVAPTGGPN